MQIPKVMKVQQIAPQPEVKDVYQETLSEWKKSGLSSVINKGSSVAIGVGSRGIANLSQIVKAAIDYFKSIGAVPFIVAAMGSHGGANSKGQRELLGEYGVSEDKLGVPVKTDMDSTVIGTNSWGEPVYWDKNALAADAVVTISRIKPHTDFRGNYESGIAKMIVIGLGKREGASQHHRWGFKGLRDMLPETAKVILEKTKFLGGLAVLENAQEKTARLEFVSKAKLMEIEPKLLEEARGLMGRLPFKALDLLIVGEIGKNYSGAGIDPNVVGRLLIEGENDFEFPKIIRMCALDLSPESHGNGTGVG
ncbi:MAG: lactate racemase domain-containing protein, partial [Planctomycetia bacterium]